LDILAYGLVCVAIAGFPSNLVRNLSSPRVRLRPTKSFRERELGGARRLEERQRFAQELFEPKTNEQAEKTHRLLKTIVKVRLTGMKGLGTALESSLQDFHSTSMTCVDKGKRAIEPGIEPL